MNDRTSKSHVREILLNIEKFSSRYPMNEQCQNYDDLPNCLELNAISLAPVRVRPSS